ncbi:hypothetical protein EV183_000540 [Coemansia sp. RSA 2336]|nr:hypothetical protein EV183_000540 [Coemansia sp. RSA 2336]
MDTRVRKRGGGTETAGSENRRHSLATASRTQRDSDMQTAQEQLNKRRLSTPQPMHTRRSSGSSFPKTRSSVQKHLLANHTAKPLSTGNGLGGFGRDGYAGARDTDSGSDSEEQDGFVKVDRWKASSEPLLAAFKPTISPTNTPTFSASGSAAKSLIPRMRSSLKATASRTLEALDKAGSTTATEADAGQRESKGEEAAGSDSEASSSDEEISDVLDEAEIQLIEAMEDTRIAGAKDKAAGAIDKEADVKDKAASATQQQQQPATKSAGCTLPQQWVGLGQASSSSSSSFTKSLRERFTAPRTANSGAINIRVVQRKPTVPEPDSSSSSSSSSSSEEVCQDSAQDPQEPKAASESGSADREQRPSSEPLDTVEFVAPGVAKETAMSLLRRVLDIDGPLIQQKMIEFLLIDGVIASMIGFITHWQGSAYTSKSSTQTAPCSPTVGSHAGFSKVSLGPGAELDEYEQQHKWRDRLARQRQRAKGLSEADLRRGYNAVQMLSNRDQFARRVVEAKLGVIVPCLMAVFHVDALGSFHHACVLLEHCFALAPLKTARLLLYPQTGGTRWWGHSTAVARGLAPICDVVPYLSEPCVQRLFLKAEFSVWTGRLMTSLNLQPNDAVALGDELNRMGLSDENQQQQQQQQQQRNKSMQLVRGRFMHLSRGGFLSQILALIESSDADVSRSVGEFMVQMIDECSAFVGFNTLFRPIVESELIVRRLAQTIINSPSLQLSVQARAAISMVHALLTKTACMYGLRTREAQGIGSSVLHARGSQVLLHVGQATRTALESFLPGLLATVAGLQETTDLTSHSAYVRRGSVSSVALPEYEEADAEETEAETSSDSESDLRSECDLRSAASAVIGASYAESMSPSSLSPSSTLSASPVAVASGTPAPSWAADDAWVAVLPRPDTTRLQLLRICIEVLREAEDLDEIMGWVDLRVWRALVTWFEHHPQNNILHQCVYQLLSAVVLEAVRVRRLRRLQRVVPSEKPEHAKTRAQRRRAAADRLRRAEATNCDNVLSYLVEQLHWPERLVRRAQSPNHAGAHGFIVLILNTLRLAVQSDRRRCFLPREEEAESTAEAKDSEDIEELKDKTESAEYEEEIKGDKGSVDEQGGCKGVGGSDEGLGSGELSSDEDTMSADDAYHDPATRSQRGEYPLSRLQRWEIALLYAPAFRAHLRTLRWQAAQAARKMVEFRLSEQPPQQRPVPFFSPQRVRPPSVLDNAELKKQQLKINVNLLLGAKQPVPASTVPAAAAPQQQLNVDEVGVDLDSLYARMLGFTEDLVGRLPDSSEKARALEAAAKHPDDVKTRRAPVARVHATRHKKSRPALFEVGPESAESICSALAAASNNNSPAVRAQPSRPRKKPTASGSVRRRRARLHHRSSNSSLNASGTSAVSSEAPELTATMQSLQLKQP